MTGLDEVRRRTLLSLTWDQRGTADPAALLLRPDRVTVGPRPTVFDYASAPGAVKEGGRAKQGPGSFTTWRRFTVRLPAAPELIALLNEWCDAGSYYDGGIAGFLSDRIRDDADDMARTAAGLWTLRAPRAALRFDMMRLAVVGAADWLKERSLAPYFNRPWRSRKLDGPFYNCDRPDPVIGDQTCE